MGTPGGYQPRQGARGAPGTSNIINVSKSKPGQKFPTDRSMSLDGPLIVRRADRRRRPAAPSTASEVRPTDRRGTSDAVERPADAVERPVDAVDAALKPTGAVETRSTPAIVAVVVVVVGCSAGIA